MTSLTTTPVQLRTYYPSYLKTFDQCPERYLHKYVERTPTNEPFSVALAKGDVAHKVLEHSARQLLRRGTLPADLRALVQARLPCEPYPSELAWTSDVEELVRQVRRGLTYIDTNILCTETTLKRPFSGDEECPPFILAAKVDLILQREDEDGPFVEVVDFKTGRPGEPDLLDQVAVRYVAKALVNPRMQGQPTRIVNTVLYLADGALRWSRELDLDVCLEQWKEIKRLVTAIEASEAWLPVPSSACEWCPYREHCSFFAHEVSGDVDLW